MVSEVAVAAVWTSMSWRGEMRRPSAIVASMPPRREAGRCGSTTKVVSAIPESPVNGKGSEDRSAPSLGAPALGRLTAVSLWNVSQVRSAAEEMHGPKVGSVV